VPLGGGRQRIVATLRQDVLIGTSAKDVFVFPTRSHSLLDRYDTIINYEVDDVIDDHHARKNVVVPPSSAQQARFDP
jgi:Ca2+-binding RTX toxin-like protein